MRMKKLMILAVAAIALVACSKTFDTHHHGNEGKAIGFSSWNQTLTKTATGRTIGGTAFANGDYFFVYGYTSGAQTPFDGTKVSTTDGSAWTYSPIRFWDHTNAYYDFYAISPSESEFASVGDLVSAHDVTAGTYTTTSLSLDGNNNDVLVADKKHVLEAAYGQSAVQLNFRHAAALFDLKVRKGSSLGNDGVLKVTSVSLENINKVGYFAVSGYNAEDHSTAPYKANITWTSTSTGTYTGANGVKNTVDTDIISSTTAVTTDGTQYLINNLVVMPQTFTASAQRLKITYTITTGSGVTEQTNTFTDKTYDLVLFDDTDYPTDDDSSTNGNQYNAGNHVTGWVDGVHYTYIITIDAEAISFTATMQAWGTDNGYYTLIN